MSNLYTTPLNKIVTISIERGARGSAGPDDGNHTHGEGDSTNTVINVTIGRTHQSGSDPKDGLDGLPRPTQLCDDLLSGKHSERLWDVIVKGD